MTKDASNVDLFVQLNRRVGAPPVPSSPRYFLQTFFSFSKLFKEKLDGTFDGHVHYTAASPTREVKAPPGRKENPAGTSIGHVWTYIVT